VLCSDGNTRVFFCMVAMRLRENYLLEKVIFNRQLCLLFRRVRIIAKRVYLPCPDRPSLLLSIRTSVDRNGRIFITFDTRDF
jgi:hypothetical protein